MSKPIVTPPPHTASPRGVTPPVGSLVASPAASDEERPEPRLRLGISSCLLGYQVRFDGGHKQDRFLLDTLGRWIDWVPLCPEVEIGLGTPRESLRLVGDPSAPRLLAPRSGSDHTEAMNRWSEGVMGQIAALDLHGFVLKRASPSCGLFRVKVYTEDGMPSHAGRGLFAATLTRCFPLLPVEEEGRLNDPPLREAFVERLFVHLRWKRFLAEDKSPAGLVRFHTAHKLTLLSHSPTAYRELGRLVAEAGSRPLEDLTAAYAERLASALTRLASRGRHANVLHHLLGFLKRRLAAPDKEELVELIERHRRGLVPLIVPVTLFRHHLRRHEVPDWVHRQVYLDPYPAELMLRNHV